ncbi:hypothetical protein OAO87_04050 [bacterium]|nr:hypothetical protein [bacterium]
MKVLSLVVRVIGWPVEAGICDDDGHPLTWGRVAAAHAWLVRHASCEAQAGGYSSDDEEGTPAGCPCTWHPVAIEERASHLAVCRAWPGPTCGTCCAVVGQLRLRLRVRRGRRRARAVAGWPPALLLLR